jgi:hypothetical protein
MPAMSAHLWVCEAGGAVLALKAWVARSLTDLQAPEEGGTRFIQAMQHVLQDLRVDLALFGPNLLDGRQLCRLHGEGHTDAARRGTAPRRLCVLAGLRYRARGSAIRPFPTSVPARALAAAGI